MFSKKKIISYTEDYSQTITKLEQEIRLADAIVIGAGAGLSCSAGLTYSGERFENNFSDFIEKYHYSDMYSAGFYPYSTPEEYWAYWSRHIYFNRYAREIGCVYDDLLKVVNRKDYFIITTNVDHLFQESGVDKHRLFYTQGDYGLWQCSKPCHAKTYSNEKIVHRMVVEQENMRIPTCLIPCCPICNSPMTMNLRCDGTFVEDNGWHLAADRYNAFIRRHDNMRVLYLELGVGNNTPVIIKYPFWKMTYQNPKVVYCCINLSEATVPTEIKGQSICISADIGKVIGDIAHSIEKTSQ